MLEFIGKLFGQKNNELLSKERKEFLEMVHLMMDGEATSQQQKFVMEKIKCCQFSNSKYELEKCLREKLKTLYCCKETPENLDQRIMDKITTIS